MTEASTPRPETETPSGSDLSALKQSAIQMEKHIVELNNTAKAARAQLWIMVIVLISIIAVFGFSTYSRVKANFSGKKAQEALNQLGPALEPLLASQAQALVTELYPVYLEQLQNQLTKAGPGLAQEITRQVETLPSDCLADLQAVVDDSFTRIADKVAPDLAKTFPGLTKEEVNKRLAEHFHVSVQQNADELHQHLQTLFTGELKLFENSMNKFQTPVGYASKTSEELNYLMLHYMFVLMDDAATNTEAGDYFQFELVSESEEKSVKDSADEQDEAPKKSDEKENAAKTSIANDADASAEL